MSRRLMIGLVLLTVFGVSAFVLRPVGEFGLIDSRIAAAHDGMPFDARIWRSGDPVKRGQMVADLARRQRFVGMHQDSVIARLGPSDCRTSPGDAPCYKMRLGHSDFELQVAVNSSNKAPRVHAIRLNRI